MISENKELKQYSYRCFIFVFPFLAFILIELFFLPITYFSGRFSESLINFSDDRRGPFYANKNLFMYEYPSRLLFSPHAETRYNQFVTDNFGLRNETAANEANNYDIVVGGASNVWGSYLDQSEIISSRLEQLCDCSVYNYGSALNNKSRMFLDERFMNNPPKIFIIIAPDTQFASALTANGQF